MPETDALIGNYSHLAGFPRADHALQMLKKIASLVKPIMRGRRMVVRQLVEFFPEDPNLLGLNVNRGSKICLRLRYARDRSAFLPFEQVVDTMLHELSHNVHGPHDSKFHALWDQLRDEHEALAMKGYTGEGFLSNGQRLGGRRVPMEEARRLARAEAEKRRAEAEKRRRGQIGHVLGGTAPGPREDIRRTIADAAARRNMTPQRCGNVNRTQDEIQTIADTATENGFRTQAEEDAANEAAIAQALWELVQEDEKARLGNEYIPPSADIPADLYQSEANNDFTPSATIYGASPTPRTWACGVCTLENPASYLCCDACGAERGGKAPAATTAAPKTTKGYPGGGKSSSSSSNSKRPRGAENVVDLTQSPPRRKPQKKRAAAPSSSLSSSSAKPSEASHQATPVAATWTCSFCGRVREREWWSCDLCGTVKQSSA